MLRFWPWAAALLSGVLLTLCFAPWNQAWLCWLALTPLTAAVLLGERRKPNAPAGNDVLSRSLSASTGVGSPPATNDAAVHGDGSMPSRASASPTSAPGTEGSVAEPPTQESTAPTKPTLWRRLRKRLKPSKAACLGYVTGLIYFWGAFSWLTTVTELGWFALAFYLALYPAVWAAILYRLRHKAGDFTRSGANITFAFLGAAAWVALEWLRGWLFTGFGWNGLGVALHANVSLIQIVEFTGIGGLSFLAAFTNLIIVATAKRFIAEVRIGKIRPHWDFSLAMAAIALVFLFGVRRLVESPAPSTPLKVVAVQANIPEEEKRDSSKDQASMDRYAALTENALALDPQLILWPEAATPRPLFSNEVTFQLVRGLAARADYNLLIGTLDFDEQGNTYNTAALLNQRGEEIQGYRKMHLGPFGEYIPFRKTFPPFEWIIGDLVPGDLAPGEEPVVMALHNPDLKAGPLVCFEDTLGDLTRQFVLRGAQVLINITNDGWFLYSQGAEQHLANAVFRAVENRRPLLRSANTGVTAFIDPYGRIIHSLRDSDGRHFLEGILSAEVAVPKAEAARLTFYTRYGELFSEACAALIFIVLLFRLRGSVP